MALQPGREEAPGSGTSAAESSQLLDSGVHFLDPRHPDRTRAREGARREDRGPQAGGGTLAAGGRSRAVAAPPGRAEVRRSLLNSIAYFPSLIPPSLFLSTPHLPYIFPLLPRDATSWTPFSFFSVGAGGGRCLFVLDLAARWQR